MTLDSYTSAVITMIGMTLDSVGGLYLAYDLLGGQDGPLSKMTRLVNYSLLFFVIFLLGFNFPFALVGGVGMGTATAMQMQRVSHDQKETIKFRLAVSSIRAVTLIWATSFVLTRVASIIAGVGIFLISFILPHFNLSPKLWYKPGVKPTFSWNKLFFSLGIGCSVGILLTIGELLGNNQHAVYTAVRSAIVVTLGIMAITLFAPTIEWWADNVPDKRMGYIGAVMFMLGFVVQSIPSLLTLLHL